jgi:hypothetical protein
MNKVEVENNTTQDLIELFDNTVESILSGEYSGFGVIIENRPEGKVIVYQNPHTPNRVVVSKIESGTKEESLIRIGEMNNAHPFERDPLFEAVIDPRGDLIEFTKCGIRIAPDNIPKSIQIFIQILEKQRQNLPKDDLISKFIPYLKRYAPQSE